MSTKSFVLLQFTNWSLTKLLQNVSSFGYNHTDLRSMITLSVEHFHSTTHVENVLMTQLEYAREFMRSIKEALKRCHPWSACYFTSMKASWYRPTENDINFRDISPTLQSKAVPSSITVADEETLRTWLIHIQEQFVKEPFARKQQWSRQGHFLTTFTQLG